MIRARLVIPHDLREQVLRSLVDDDCVTNVVVFDGVAHRPEGDVVECDITREATERVLEQMRGLGVHERGGVALTVVDASPSPNAWAAERAAPGSPEDAVVLEEVVDTAYNQVRPSWSYYAFLTLAVLIAAVAVVQDSAILVVGAMVVGPEFGVVAALAIGVALGKRRLVREALVRLATGFAVAIAITVVVALLARWAGWIDVGDVTGERPLTGFIWRPDRWSLVVALLAGCAGVLSQTAGRTNVLVGVFISVTTVPAAGDLALSVAVWAPQQIGGSAAQLGINLVGMTVAGAITLTVQRALLSRLHAHRAPRPGPDPGLDPGPEPRRRAG